MNSNYTFLKKESLKLKEKTVIGENGVSLSGGQIQRIGISADAFKTKIQSDWWMDAYTALIYNCVDEII